jgi:hypothetical protein
MRPRGKDRIRVSLSEKAADAALVDLGLLAIGQLGGGVLPAVPFRSFGRAAGWLKASRCPRFVLSSRLPNAAVVPAGDYSREPLPRRLQRSRAPAPSATAVRQLQPTETTAPKCLFHQEKDTRTTLAMAGELENRPEGGRTHSPGAALPSFVCLPLSLGNSRYIFGKAA